MKKFTQYLGGVGLLAAFLLTGCVASNRPVTFEEITKEWSRTNNISYEILAKKGEGVAPEGSPDAYVRYFSKDKNKTRMEANIDGRQTVFITNEPDGLDVMYYPEGNYYLNVGAFGEGGASASGIAKTLDLFYANLEAQYTIDGEGVVQGRPAARLVKKPEVTEDVADIIFIDKKLLFPTEIIVLDDSGAVKSDVELQNVSKKLIPADYFMLPKDAVERDILDVYKELYGDLPDDVQGALDAEDQTTDQPAAEPAQ